MTLKRYLAALALASVASAAFPLADLTQYLPVYNLEQTKLIPFGTRTVLEDNREGYDYQAQLDYDEQGRLVAKYYAGYNAGWGSAEHYKWSPDGRLLSSTIAEHGSDVSLNDFNTTFTTDAQGRVTGFTRVCYFTSPPDINRVKTNEVQCTYTYDAQGNCTKVTIKDDGREYDYELGRVGAPNPTVQEIVYQYDSNGRLVRAVEYINNRQNATETFEYGVGKEEREYLKRTERRERRFEGEGYYTVTTDYTPFGIDLPSGYLMKETVQGPQTDDAPFENTLLILYQPLPLSETEQ